MCLCFQIGPSQSCFCLTEGNVVASSYALGTNMMNDFFFFLRELSKYVYHLHSSDKPPCINERFDIEEACTAVNVNPRATSGLPEVSIWPPEYY